jgi:hypothetical protein
MARRLPQSEQYGPPHCRNGQKEHGYSGPKAVESNSNGYLTEGESVEENSRQIAELGVRETKISYQGRAYYRGRYSVEHRKHKIGAADDKDSPTSPATRRWITKRFYGKFAPGDWFLFNS